MSFSKARIQRFNELTSVAPPPGAYDPKFDSKVKGPIIDKPGRSYDAKSTTSSGPECNASVSSRSTSNASLKQFRTPQIPKKRVVVKPTAMSCSRLKTKTLYSNETKNQQVPYEPQHELADLKIECENKNKTIHEYEKHMDDMKNEIRDLSEKYETLQKKHSQIEEQHQKDIESMAKLQQEVMENKNEKYQTEMQALQSQLSRISSTLEKKHELIQEKEAVEVELKAKISSLEEELQRFKEENNIVEKMEQMVLATQKLDKMTEELNEALNLKDMQMTDLLKLQTETERKLIDVQTVLEKSEKQVAELEANLESIANESVTQASPITPELIEKMTNVLQEYFDYDNYDGKWNIENMSFSPEIEDFLKNIRKFVTDLKLTYEREIELSRDNFNEERENLEQDLEMKRTLIINLENKLTETNETNAFLTEELQDVQKLYKDVNRNIHEIKADLEEANEKYAKAIASHKAEIELMSKIHEEEQTKLKDLLEEARSEYLKELDNMTTARNEELSEVKQAMEKRIEDEKKRMKECANKMVENAEAVTRETLKACRAESEERVRRVIAETDAKVNLLTREAKTTSEEELRQVTEKYNASLDHLESEKASLNTKLAQRDLDVIRLTAALEEMKCTAETQESFSQSLQAELDRAEAELVEKKEELRNLKDQIRTESAEMVARRRRFEVVMAENQASVAALTRRLAQSESEVERLQRELQTKEGSLVGYRELLDNITSNSKMVQEQLDSIADKVDEKVEHISQLEVKSANEINMAKTMFSAKIESLKTVTIEELIRVQNECKEKSERNVELQVNLHQMVERLNDATNLLLKLEEINDEQSIDISKLQLQNTKLMQKLDNKNQIIEEHKMCYELQSEQYKTEMNEMNDQLSRLREEMKLVRGQKNAAEDKKYDFEELKLKFNDQLEELAEKLKVEKDQRTKSEKQAKQYEQTCERLAEECQQITDKYTEVMNHNNHKQRMKHVSQLKEKINNQQLELLRLRQELDSKSNLIEELRLANDKQKPLDERRHVGVGKENLHSLASISSPLNPGKTLFPKSANTTPVSSPHKPHTPLRDRNE